MKIFSAKQLGEADVASMKMQSISSWELMERASKKAVEAILPLIHQESAHIHIFCGMGNNGGDGLAIAYHLGKLGYSVQVYKVAFTNKTSKDFDINAKRLQKDAHIKLKSVTEANVKSIKFNTNDVVIDAIFGVGLNRRMPDFVEELVLQINTSDVLCISIDIPSGMFLNQAVPKEANFIQPDVCLTFQLPKLPLFFTETGKYIQNFKILPIGLSQEAIEQIDTDYFFMHKVFIKNIYKKRNRFSHKGTHGHALLVGGQKGMLGSVLLAAKSALRSGVGKLSVMLPSSGQDSLHHFLPEAIALENPSKNFIHFTDTQAYNAVGVGVGIGKSDAALKALKAFLEQVQSPVLIDADALNLIAVNPILLEELPKNSILTPHPGELKRLIGNWKDDFDKLNKIKNFAKEHHCVLVAKEAYTCICDGASFYFNSTGNSGMATAGSGDVLSGIITALLAQNYNSLEAAQLGVYIHGLAGDLALQQESHESMIASDLISFLGKAFKELNY
jgi:hydroxyethylthiazole kinase-like uncharacterized protein yjeF